MKTQKKLLAFLILLLNFCYSPNGFTQKKNSEDESKQKFKEISNLINSNNYEQASREIFALIKNPKMIPYSTHLRYWLGVSMLGMKLHQTAAFQFVHVVKSNTSQYLKPSLERLSMIADYLGDETLLNYAIKKIEVADFPAAHKDALFYRLGEIKLKNGEFKEALDTFSKVDLQSRYYDQARFKLGIAYLEDKRPLEAVKIYKALLRERADLSLTHSNRISIIIALARSFYQAQKWEESIEYYRQIPRDTELWHNALFEMSWADLRAARFRSALSNFQTLHSTYYEDSYFPESLLLRGIVYLYICKYDEMEKVLDLFEKNYGAQLRTTIDQLAKNVKDSLFFYNDIEKIDQIRKNPSRKMSSKIPFNVGKKILEEGDVSRAIQYLKLLSLEKNRLEKTRFYRDGLGKYSLKILNNRIKNSKQALGETIREHLISMHAELNDLNEQASFIRYEMINGRKEQLKSKIAGKVTSAQLDDDKERDFYIQNGYEYWPFMGEYWLDELGNYQYLGKQSCE